MISSNNPSNPLSPMGQPGGTPGPAGERDIPSNLQVRRSGNNPLHQVHEYHAATYDKALKAKNLLEHIRKELDTLVTKGDTVTPDEVIGAAGRLVGHGVDARGMAELLANMPTMAGQGLAAWLQQQDMAVMQQEMEVERASRATRNRMGVSAIQALAASHFENENSQQTQTPQAPQSPQGPDNALGPSNMGDLAPRR